MVIVRDRVRVIVRVRVILRLGIGVGRLTRLIVKGNRDPSALH